MNKKRLGGKTHKALIHLKGADAGRKKKAQRKGSRKKIA